LQYPSGYQYDDRLEYEPTSVITVREVVYDPLEIIIEQPEDRSGKPILRAGCATLFVFLICSIAGFLGIFIGHSLYMSLPPKVTYVVVDRRDPEQVATTISPLFTAEVQYWAPQIATWAEEYNLDPNLIATVIQIESCGDPTVGSSAGAQGLFQVMPFHFATGEVMTDVQTNAMRGLNYLSQGLAKAEGNAGLALAGYNGGHGVISWGWARWPDETRRYFYWGSGIYEDATAGETTSDRLQEWLQAGGSGLCQRASATQQTLRDS
jgi:hypothetical protein